MASTASGPNIIASRWVGSGASEERRKRVGSGASEERRIDKTRQSKKKQWEAGSADGWINEGVVNRIRGGRLSL